MTVTIPKKDQWDMNAGCVLVTSVGGSYLMKCKCSLVGCFKQLIYFRYILGPSETRYATNGLLHANSPSGVV